MEFENYTLEGLNYVDSLSNEIIFELTVDPKFLDKNYYLDKGYLFSVIDSVTSKSAFLYDQKLLFHVSINIKIIFLKELKLSDSNPSLVIKTKVKSSKSLLFLECSIYDKSGNLYLVATHIKRKVKFKF